jgi:lipopolysaccharide export LptBFGC system permease protein LptF
MTLEELREAARTARAGGGAGAAARAAAYEVEIQKKFALAAACLFLALAGAALAVRFPRAGRALLLTASAVVFGGYYVAVVAGDALADQQVIPPLFAMWMANVVLLAFAALLIGRPGGAVGRPPETLACEG